MNLRNTLKIVNNDLIIGGVSVVELAKQYPTPCYIMDVEYIRSIIRAYKRTLDDSYGNAIMTFASKAFSCTAMYEILKQEGVYADVVSGGEIYTALSAKFDLSRAYFHGNNKTYEELNLALDNRIGVVVIDSLQEIDMLDKLAAAKGIKQSVNIRVNPGVEAHTHSYIQTSKLDSKFGFSIAGGNANEAISTILKRDNLILNGINCHIGSQIFDTSAYRLAVKVMTDYLVHIGDKYEYHPAELNMGGGFGVHYVDGDPKYTVEDYCNYVRIITEELNNCIELNKLAKPRLVIEPGRSIVAESGITLYKIGTIKEIKNVIKYLCVDGGMGDNIRPGLYQAEYEAIIVNKSSEPADDKVTIAGKFCESTDILIKNIMLPKAESGDLLAVFTTGAYNYSMASNYNRTAVPPVIMVENGMSDYAVIPQSYEDIIRNDRIPNFLK